MPRGSWQAGGQYHSDLFRQMTVTQQMVSSHALCQWHDLCSINIDPQALLTPRGTAQIIALTDKECPPPPFCGPPPS